MAGLTAIRQIGAQQLMIVFASLWLAPINVGLIKMCSELGDG